MIAVDGVDLASWWRCNWFSCRGFSSWRCWLFCCAWAINRARAAVGAVRVAGTVVRALVEIVAVALVLAYARTIAIGDTLISDGNAVVDAFVSFVAPNNEALFDDGRILGIAAPSWAGAAVGAFLVAGASVHASVLVRSAD